MRLLTVIAILGSSLLLAMAGCNGSSESGEPSEGGVSKVTSGPIAITVETQDATGEPSDDFASGQQITFTMTAQNVSAQAQTFNVQTCFGTAAYAVFKQGTTDEVGGGYMKEGANCQSVARGGTPITLAPGQSFNTSVTWPQGTTGGQLVPAGSYSAIAGIACVQSDACMPTSSADKSMLPISDSTIYRSTAVSFTINP